MDLRQALREIAIAFVGDDDRSARLGDEKIGAGDADVGGEEFFAQDFARFRQQRDRLADGRVPAANPCAPEGKSAAI